MWEKILDLSTLEELKEEGKWGQVVMNVNRKINLQKCVITKWRIEEEVEDICTLKFDFELAKKWNNMKYTFSCYQIQRDAKGRAVLVRISE